MWLSVVGRAESVVSLFGAVVDADVLFRGCFPSRVTCFNLSGVHSPVQQPCKGARDYTPRCLLLCS